MQFRNVGSSAPGKDAEGPPDGPARVLKPGDWGPAPDLAMKNFQMESFLVPGRVQPKQEPADLKITELNREIKKAQDAVKQALVKAEKEKETAVAAALERGRAEGRLEGESQAWEKHLSALKELQANTSGVLAALGREKDSLFLEFEGQVLELLSGSLHRVFEGMADQHAQAVLPLVKKAVAALGESSSITIKTHPDDFRTVEDNQPYWLPINASLKQIRIVADDRIQKGGCFVECDSTSVAVHAHELADRIDEELKKVFLAKIEEMKNAAGQGASVTPVLPESAEDSAPGDPSP